MQDKLILGGHEFTSRFILGSGKYSLDLINAAVHNAGAQIITLALRRANEGGMANILDYIPKGVTPAAQHFGRAQRGRGGAYRTLVARGRLRRLRQDRDHARLEISAA